MNYAEENDVSKIPNHARPERANVLENVSTEQNFFPCSPDGKYDKRDHERFQ
jgi:hypothetical protein